MTRSCFGLKIKELRKAYKLTQQEVADKIGVTKSVISFYERSERAPSPEILIRFTEVFQVTSDYLLGIEKTNDHSIDLSGLSQQEIEAIQSVIAAFRSKH